MDDLGSAAKTKEENIAAESADSKAETLDIGDSTLVRRYSPRLKYGHKDNFAEKQTIPEILIPCRITPLNMSFSEAPFSTEDSIVNKVQGGGANGTSDSEKEDDDVKTEESSEMDVEKVSVSEQSTPEADINDGMSDHRKEMADTSTETHLDADTVSENAPVACKTRSSTAEDLDEMMDIGTVDQVDQEAQMKGEDLVDLYTTCSPASSNTEKEQSSPSAGKNGRKRVRLGSDTTQVETSSSPSPPLVNVKDEPADEEYDEAVTSTAASLKDEPNGTREDLRIGTVFSVTPATEAQTLPVLHPLSGHMFCSHCKKALVKGQMAFQRRSSPALFCSTSCLTTFLPAVKRPSTVCHNCHKLIFQPQDIILSPAGKDTLKEFCTQSCLTSFNEKNNNATQKPSQTVGLQSCCSMCSKCCISKHDVVLNGTVHKLCSDACFKWFRTVKKLSMACCANCGNYCHNKPLLLQLDGSSQTLCNAECLAKYKEKTKVSQPCMLCQAARMLEDMVDNKNDDDSVNLFCSSSCVMAYKVQTVSASATRLNCDNCEKNRVPAYHLAMSDTSIRNFCTLSCVMAFQEKLRQSQKQESSFTKLPIGSSHTATPTQPRGDLSRQHQKLNCFQCSCHITSKPEVIQIKGKLVFVCSVKCCEELKKANCLTSLCENCKIEKITTNAKRINNKDCFFCSDECKVLFRRELTKSWGRHCNSCVYCHALSQKLVTATYGGSTEEFCSEDCRSKYTMLFCHVAKCDSCGHKGKLKQNLPMLGDVKHFCDLTCLLQFCCDNVATHEEIFKRPKAPDQTTPVIADVISLADPHTQETSAADTAAKQSTASENSRTINVQTDSTDAHPSLPPPTKVLKNKALLCKPLVRNKGVSCKTQTAECGAQTETAFPQVMVVPVPVPVYVPLPMNMYTQCTPRPLGVPLPLPVPMFLPVTMDSAERIVETIQEIKEKIPSDPFEAELIFMAEMVAEDNEKNSKGQSPKNKVVEKKNEKREAPDPYDHTRNCRDGLDTDDLASLLNSWEDASSDPSLRTQVLPDSHEKSVPALSGSTEPHPEAPPPLPPPGPPPLDIEADVTVETLERISRHEEISQKSPSSPPSALRRQQASRKSRETKTKGRTSQRLSKASEAILKKECVQKKPVVFELPKLKSQYGVDAWKRWIQQRQTQPDLEKLRYASRSMLLKEDVLQCTTAELSYGLCCFISEVKRPNGTPYTPDSLFYLCLGIQQYLFENGRVENIFMDQFYNKFSAEFTCMLKDFKPSVTASGYIHSRVEEEFLWDCKQLGAYSPIVLLNTLLFFCCKHFGFTTVKQHRQLSFARLMRCTKTNENYTKTTFLCFYPPLTTNETEQDVPSKRRKEEESKDKILEMMENTENPLRCPVRLFEFYLSKCSESVKQRSNVFYLLPERCCVPNSPLWFSTTPLDDSTMEAMLIRILSVRDLHVRTSKRGRRNPSDDSQCIPEDDRDSD
eukprot:XP_011607143.1 PREDICTED: zinc finger MYM-type protein 4-like [Takifugu rubripes]